MITLHKKIIPPFSFDLLQDIQGDDNFERFYLAGGTALALQLGHRISIDLDFFTAKEFKSNQVNFLDKPYEIISCFDNSIELIKDDTKVFFFYFGFPLKYDLVEVEGLYLANNIDIGLMKLLALQGRTTKKDIIDLFFIDQEVIPLEELLVLFETHYPKDSFNSYQSLKKLINTSDLEGQPLPRMFKEFDWEIALSLVQSKVAAHIRQLLSIV